MLCARSRACTPQTVVVLSLASSTQLHADPPSLQRSAAVAPSLTAMTMASYAMLRLSHWLLHGRIESVADCVHARASTCARKRVCALGGP